MIIPIILKVFVCLFQCLTLILKNDLPSFLEILIFELVLELIELCSLIQSFDGVVPETNLDAQHVTLANELIPIVHTFTVWKICEALDLKAKFVPVSGTTVFTRTQHRGVVQMTTVPVVRSFSVWKICQVLDLPATYDPQLYRANVFRKPYKLIPVVQSTVVFELCKMLNLTVSLASQ
ncbi:hypothetical protein TNIN_160121 [Trichonephila inaurata madagascariensis]|uniref:Uncharacterized protein n=1 Tax=Trichonephila inaurata madagascariensis TaxID=2747483 RepID=A0A8X6YQM7_9ARAC|nr:hypothetical protein TNIN_160121 [Trichonephila inaurata madagascariensis]